MSKDFYVEARKIQYQIDELKLAIDEEVIKVEMLYLEPDEASDVISGYLREIEYHSKQRFKLNEEAQ